MLDNNCSVPLVSQRPLDRRANRRYYLPAFDDGIGDFFIDDTDGAITVQDGHITARLTSPKSRLLFEPDFIH